MWEKEINRGYQHKERKTKTAKQALNSLMALCAKAEKSSGDARRLMTQWGVPQEEQPEVLTRLLEDRFIDDERYAAAFIREKTNLNGWGEYKIRQQLSLKGVAKEIIDDQLQNLNHDALNEKLEEQLCKKIRSTKYQTKQQLREKLLRYATSRGHSFSAANEIISKLTSELPL